MHDRETKLFASFFQRSCFEKDEYSCFLWNIWERTAVVHVFHEMIRKRWVLHVFREVLMKRWVLHVKDEVLRKRHILHGQDEVLCKRWVLDAFREVPDAFREVLDAFREVHSWTKVATSPTTIFKLVGPCEILSHGQQSKTKFVVKQQRLLSWKFKLAIKN